MPAARDDAVTVAVDQVIDAGVDLPGPPAATGISIVNTPPSTGVEGVAVTIVLRVNGSLPANTTVTLSQGPDGSSVQGTFLAGSAPADVTLSPVPASAGSKTWSFSNTGGLTNPGDLSFTASAAPSAPAGDVVQFLTSDGGSSPTVGNYSGPTRDKWHNRLGAAWPRIYSSGDARYGRGNWRDAAQVAEGPTPFASSGALTAVGQVASIDVLTLVQRWISNGNRGALLNSRVSAWPVRFHGRAAAAEADRPKLLVTTSTGTFELTAAANATWAKSSFTGSGSALRWTVAADAQTAILRFDLSSVTGTVTAATLTCKVESFPSGGSTGQIIDVFEADPPTLIDPQHVTESSVLGLAAGYADFNALKVGGNPALIFADDFETPGWADSATAFVPAAPRILNPATNTTYARGTIATGANESANVRRDVSQGTGPQGTPNVVIPELFGQYWLHLESTFGTTQDDAIKIPAMGVQFGYWNPVGYWQQTTGNGGTPGTGLKVWNATQGKWEYQGHSVRFLTGKEPAAGDDDPYTGWFGIGIYPYNLDQGGPFPVGGPFPNVVIKKGVDYCFDTRVKQNSMSGSQDADGNYDTANPDGVYQVWINGHLAYNKTDYRWRRHAEFGVQGMWIDVYHGGTTTAPRDMHYRVDRVSLATSYIGPPPAALPSWVPAPGELVSYTAGGGVLTNNYRSVVADYYDTFYSIKSVNDYSGAFKNPYWGSFGATIFWGGGHAGTNHNGVTVLEYEASTLTFKRVCDPTPWFGTGTDATTQGNNGGGTPTNHLLNLTYMEALADGKPGSPHSYATGDVIPPASGGGAFGTFLQVMSSAVNRQNDAGAQAAHQLVFSTLEATTSRSARLARNWQRVTNLTGPWALSSLASPGLTAFVPAHNRVYLQANSSYANVRWFDRAINNWATGTGTTFGYDLADGFDSGIMFHVPERDLLICAYPVGGNLRVQWMNVAAGVTQPTLGGTATLSAAIATGAPWSAGTWCKHSNRLIVGVTGANGVYEIAIPATLTDPWPVEFAAFEGPGAGSTLPLEAPGSGGNTYKKFEYDEKVRSIVFMRTALNSGNDTVHVYRPRGT